MTALLSPEQKLAGSLVPLFALRGKYDLGIGDVAALREAVEWAAAQGLGFLQVLPVNLTGGDHSPYNLLSSMALEPCTLSYHPNDLPDLSLAEYERMCRESPPKPGGTVDYPAVKALQKKLMESAWEAFAATPKKSARWKQFHSFQEAEAEWLDPFTLHQALSEHLQLPEVLSEWPSEVGSFAEAGQWLEQQSKSEKKTIAGRRAFFSYGQWRAHQQWRELRQFANSKGVALIGDVPVGVSIHSVDVWTESHLFDLSRSCGAPPEKVFQADPFTMQWGQNWGFPLYDWFAMSKDNFRWWRRRLQSLRQCFDLLRVDHALGFFRIYSFPWRPEQNADFFGITPGEARAKTGGALPAFIPFDDDTEEHREANRTHGETLIGILVEETGPQGLIAEDLGEVPPYVRPSLQKMGVPGFKIPQWEREKDGTFTPGAEYPRLSIATYGTHDHPPLLTIWNDLIAELQQSDPERRTHASNELREWLDFCGASDLEAKSYGPEISAALFAGLWQCNSWLAAATINDLLGTDDRFNTPGTMGGQNWTARLPFPVEQWVYRHGDAIASWKKSLLKRKG